MITRKLNPLIVLALVSVLGFASGCGTSSITSPDGVLDAPTRVEPPAPTNPTPPVDVPAETPRRIDDPEVSDPTVPVDVPMEIPARIDAPTVGVPRRPVTPAAARPGR